MDAFTAVVNPAAGRGAAIAASRRLAAALVPHLPPGAVRIVHSHDRAHAAALAARACAQGRVVLAVGGDGQAAALAAPVVAAGGVLGLVPAGRGNDFARQLGVPADPVALAALLRDGPIRTVDVIRADTGDIALGSVYAGVDSRAGAIVNASPRVPGPLVYPYGAVRALLTSRPAHYRLELDGQPWDARGHTVVVANSGFYGAGMHIVPTASPDDGLLDVLLLKDSSRWGLVVSLGEVYRGTHLSRPDVEVRRARHVHLHVDGDVPVHADGEPFRSSPVSLTVRPGALRVIAPLTGA